MTGPVTVNGTVYEPPEVSGMMPGIAATVSDEELTSIICYLRYTFAEGVNMVGPKLVARWREKTRNRANMFTEEDLRKMKFED